MIGLTVASTALQVKSSRDAGQIASKEAELAARKEGDAGRQREIERRRALIRALASQNAQAGASGITTDGSVGAVAQSDIKQFQNDLLGDYVNTKNQQSLYRTQGKNAKRAGNIGAGMALLDGAAKVGALGDGKYWNKP